jgi:hypothetical protein
MIQLRALCLREIEREIGQKSRSPPQKLPPAAVPLTMAIMARTPATSRIIFRMPLKTVADRRNRRAVPTVPHGEVEFTESEQEVFKHMERRLPRPLFTGLR